MVAALKDEDLGSGTSLIRQRQQISAWQEFLHILSRRPCSELNRLLQQYRLFPDWLIVFDEHRLQAWLPAENGFYLLRHNELRRLRPTTPRDELPAAAGSDSGPRLYYSLALNANDQFFILPPALFNLFSPGEAAAILLGLRQLPAKVGELISTARMRGFSDEITWFSMQVLRLEEDKLPDGVRNYEVKQRKPILTRLFGQTRPLAPDESGSESVGPADCAETADQATRQDKTLWTLLTSRWFPYVLGGGLLALALIVGAIVLLSSPGDTPAPSDTTGSSTGPVTSATVETQQTTLETTAGPTPTPALPQLVVSARRLNLRSEPNSDSTLLLTLNTGDLLYQLEEPAEDWVKVQTAEGLQGYVYFDYVTSATAG